MSTDMIVRGEVVDPRDEEITALEGEVKRLRRELAVANGDIARAKNDAAGALGGLRKQLTPLYRALQSVFGELDAAGIDEPTVTATTGNPRVSAVWENWKQRMPGAPAKVIDALLLHRDMSQQQLCIATGIPRGSMTNVISRLNKAGLLNKNGWRISLKEL